MSELDKCYDNDESSFLNKLFYKDVFDNQQFELLCQEIINKIRASNHESQNVDYNLIKKCFFVSNKFSQIVISHYDSNDSYSIRNNHSDIRLYLDRWFFLVDCILDNDYLRAEAFEDDLGTLVKFD